jgi:hypothetical protein
VIVVRSLQSTQQISNLQIRELVQQRINDLGGEAFDTNTLGYFLVIEPGDTLKEIDAQLGFTILANRFTGIAYDQPGFSPSFEFVEQFPFCYDLVLVLSDDGYGVEVLVEKAEGVPSDLRIMCRVHAMQGTT